MGRVEPLKIAAMLAACAVLFATVAASAGGATVRVGKLVLRADGGFAPRMLPRREYAPIRFQGHADIKTTDGSPPPALQRIRLDFDRDGRLTTAGLPVCQPAQLAGATPQQARSRCAGALVGTGHVKATIGVPGLRVNVTAPLSLFNGPGLSGNRTVIAHSQTIFPLPETYVVTIPVERRRGVYGYRSTFDLPPIAGGFGALTHIDAKIGRRYRAGGAERSYISARCSDGILQTLGLATFADGTVISGSLFKGCQALP
ncbi:MAG TPA: hypothetical protein VNP96_10180 [Solirubrobacterales bacterium]|nr:hypothetical protein [Solirubrobacterales bacterium]